MDTSRFKYYRLYAMSPLSPFMEQIINQYITYKDSKWIECQTLVIQ